jgi:hypothetical protein
MASRVTRYRFLVLAVLCSLSFLTYLDRICIMRVQDDIVAISSSINPLMKRRPPPGKKPAIALPNA